MTYSGFMNDPCWTVKLSSRTAKAISELPEHVRLKMLALMKDLQARGVTQPTWPHYSKLGNDTYHCHIKRGRPTYVVCWKVLDKKDKIIEVYYAGTHEKAPY